MEGQIAASLVRLRVLVARSTLPDAPISMSPLISPDVWDDENRRGTIRSVVRHLRRKLWRWRHGRVGHRDTGPQRALHLKPLNPRMRCTPIARHYPSGLHEHAVLAFNAILGMAQRTGRSLGEFNGWTVKRKPATVVGSRQIRDRTGNATICRCVLPLLPCAGSAGESH